MPEREVKGKDMRLRIMACRQVYTGRNSNGHEYTIYEIDAAKLDGTQIREKLRAFQSLPIGQEIEVTVAPFNSERHGKSFTLHPKTPRSESATAKLNELHEQVEQQREMIAKLSSRLGEVEMRLGELMRDEAQQARLPAATASSSELDARFGAGAPW